MFTSLLINSAKVISTLSQKLNLGNGSTWPGYLVLKIQPNIIENILSTSSTEIILVIGTNGKTTTSKILTTILKEARKSVIQNTSGANLLNGIASTLLLHTNPKGRLSAQYAVFEVDENSLPLVLQHLTPKAVIALNLFRDQLDRYGELDSIAKKWNKAFRNLPHSSTLILNGDDPLIAYLAKDVTARVEYFALEESAPSQKKLEESADSIYCPQCGNKLEYKKVFYSHLGIWDCPNCSVKRPQPHISTSRFPLPGIYNEYNTIAAVLCAKQLGITPTIIDEALQKVTPAFGRQEKLHIKGKYVQLFLSKNPTSFNESLRTIVELSARDTVIPAKAGIHSSRHSELDSESEKPGSQIKSGMTKPTVLLVLNDRIPDGRDVSWIWDIQFENYVDKLGTIIVSGDRTYDMGIRLQYANGKYPISNIKYQMYENLKEAVEKALEATPENQTLYILPTYSAMLDVRKILTGRKIL